MKTTRVGRRLRIALPGLVLLAGVTAQAAGAQTPAPRSPASVALRCPLDAPYDGSNPFARIFRGEAPVSLIAENSLVLAFVPLGWSHRGHALVAPRRAVRNLGDLTDAEMIAVMHMVRRVALAQRRALGSTGYTLEQNNGRNQDVCHAHFHVIPNTPSDETTGRRTRAEMDEVAAALRASLPPE